MNRFKNTRLVVIVLLISFLIGCGLSRYSFSTHKADGYSESSGGIIQINEGWAGNVGANDYLRILSLNGKPLDDILQLFVPAGKHRVKITHASKKGCRHVPWGGTYGSSSCSYFNVTHELQIDVSPSGVYEIRLDPTDYSKVVVTKGVCSTYECIQKFRIQ